MLTVSGAKLHERVRECGGGQCKIKSRKRLLRKRKWSNSKITETDKKTIRTVEVQDQSTIAKNKASQT